MWLHGEANECDCEKKCLFWPESENWANDNMKPFLGSTLPSQFSLHN